LRASAAAAGAPVESPNIFKLYEENIGPLTPMIADALKDDESLYTETWVAEAIQIAVRSNARSLKFIEAVLKRWKDEGRAEKQDRRNPEKDRDKYVKGEYADYVEH
jgi:DnaD/phage-associated family protein